MKLELCMGRGRNGSSFLGKISSIFCECTSVSDLKSYLAYTISIFRVTSISRNVLQPEVQTLKASMTADSTHMKYRQRRKWRRNGKCRAVRVRQTTASESRRVTWLLQLGFLPPYLNIVSTRTQYTGMSVPGALHKCGTKTDRGDQSGRFRAGSPAFDPDGRLQRAIEAMVRRDPRSWREKS